MCYIIVVDCTLVRMFDFFRKALDILKKEKPLAHLSDAGGFFLELLNGFMGELQPLSRLQLEPSCIGN